MSGPTKGAYFLHQDDGKMWIYPETWKGKPNREAMLALMATVSPWGGALQYDRSEVMAQAVANGHLLAASWEMREALTNLLARVDSHFGGPDASRDWKEQQEARAALAKAQGARHEG